MSIKIVESPPGSGKTAWAAATSTFVVGGSPADMGLPCTHIEWRVKQYEILEWLTGGHRASVIALCRTKNLQAENYGRLYDAAVLFGRGNYQCIHPDAERGTTCAECLYIDTSMYQCEYSTRCPYLVAKGEARSSPFTALNYAYYLTARWPREDGAQVLFLDEAHQLSEITLDFAGCTITHKNKVEWNLPEFPEITSASGLLIRHGDPVVDAVDWLLVVRQALRIQYVQLKNMHNRKLMSKCENLGRKVSATLDALRQSPQDWYIRSGSRAQKFRGRYRPAFIARPLTARHRFESYFLNDTTIAMSATIGNPSAFSEELGITSYEFRAVPNQFSPDMRKVHILDTPKMGRKATPEDYSRQADVIALAIKSCPSDWSGLIHVTRKREAKLLADRLARRGLQDRVWVMPGWDGIYTPTDDQARAWNHRRNAVSGSICLSWALWEGHDGLDEKINIVAKSPFPFLGSDYERERLNYSGKFYLQRTAYQLEQGLGRTRRGRPEDYGDENGFVAVADMNFTRVKKYLSESLREALVEE